MLETDGFGLAKLPTQGFKLLNLLVLETVEFGIVFCCWIVNEEVSSIDLLHLLVFVYSKRIEDFVLWVVHSQNADFWQNLIFILSVFVGLACF